MFWLLLSLLCGEISGVITDTQGARVPRAAAVVSDGTGTVVASVEATSEGTFQAANLPPGGYLVRIAAPGLAEQTLAVRVPGDALQIRLSVAGASSAVTVTASRGEAGESSVAAAVITVRDRGELLGRPMPVIGNVLEGGAGILVQQTTAGQVSPFLRGLTGYQVLNLVDGVRFNNATFRSGPNQYLAFLEASQAQRVEAMLGPAGAAYGSDALGGTIQVVTVEPRFGGVSGELNLLGGTADWSGGLSGAAWFGSKRTALGIGGALRRHNDLRAGGGVDSRNVFRRYFGLDNETIRGLVGGRQQDTGFTQGGGFAKLAGRWTDRDLLTVWYQRSEIDRVRGYKDLLGGLGRLQSDFDPQQMDFVYGRYTRLGAFGLDSAAATVSWNSQRDAGTRQGLRLTDAVTRDDSEVGVAGLAGQARKTWRAANELLFGGEWYDERIASRRTENGMARRPLYPDGSRYRTQALFGQQSVFLLGGRLRLQGGGRYTGVRYRTRADERLGVIESRQSFADASFHGSALWRMGGGFSLLGTVGRGFRAPNANDLGAVGLNDLGFELPAPAGAILSTSAGENAQSTGRRLSSLKPERLFNFEGGVRWSGRRVELRAQGFDAELLSPIVRRTLLFPAESVPREIAGFPLTAIDPTPEQRAQGVRTVATVLDPRAVKSFVNDGHSRYYGFETLGRWSGGNWIVEGTFTYIMGRELNPNRPIRRLPPQMGQLRLRRTMSRGFWWELSATGAGRQSRLSGGDVDDERIGASRTRRDIAAFFAGARVAGLLREGVFTPTGETLGQIQNRVLPGVSDTARVPLFSATAGWLRLDARGGMPLTDRISLMWGLENVFDRNYRVHGSGVDGPGRNVYAGVRMQF